ncbi:tail fiber assembly protein [Xenorhabdus sp. SF857]|uniref:tail fiber assembly protein n=1 Tax=Xenorhabdus bakwenae TaxID=3026967 RepID=UPI002557F853|nr:tail fiber assembly protein [Xenorhabdus sp. SF857]WFQ80928.1 tail fiber assembly protein [Xenorhabdus sp. SF857]
MNYFYSAKNNAFCPIAWKQNYVDAGSWPDDGIAVSVDVFNEFAINAPPAGKIRIAGPDGLPSWGDIPPPTSAELQQQAESQKRHLMSQAANAITPLQYAADLKMATNAEQSKLTEWKKYTVLLNRVDCSTAPDIDWPKTPE